MTNRLDTFVRNAKVLARTKNGTVQVPIPPQLAQSNERWEELFQGYVINVIGGCLLHIRVKTEAEVQEEETRTSAGLPPHDGYIRSVRSFGPFRLPD